jgi:hypothetical protein
LTFGRKAVVPGDVIEEMFHVKIDVGLLRHGNKGVDMHVAVLPFKQLPIDASNVSLGYNLADGMDATLTR